MRKYSVLFVVAINHLVQIQQRSLNLLRATGSKGIDFCSQMYSQGRAEKAVQNLPKR